MKIKIFVICVLTFVGFIIALGTGTLNRSEAAGYPIKPIQIVVPYSPGGITDVLVRLTAEKSQEYLGQPMVVLNKPGAGGLLGADFVANSEPDGHLIANVNIATHGIAPAIRSKVPYDPVKSFSPICLLITNQNVILVNGNSKWDTLQKLIDYAKENPNKLNFGSSGVGTSNHLTGELLQQAAGIKMTHIPHKGASPALMALLGGHIDVMVSNVVGAIEQIKAKKVIPLAVTSPKRIPLLPEVPSVVELGYPGVLITPWHGVGGPAGLSEDMVGTLAGYFKKVLDAPEIRQKIIDLGMTPAYKGPAGLAKWIQDELSKYKTLAEKANIRID
jgi:tripartite-type tricarboxylate transporter receptor subunit TctC